MNKNNKIYLIYAKEQSQEAMQIRQFLEVEKGLEIEETREGCFVFQSTAKIVQESAVILISDDAVADAWWQEQVRGLEATVRIIPVGETCDADYSDQEVIPPRVEEINFIRIDDECMVHVWNSLTTDPEFYRIKSQILSKMNSWLFYGYDTFLLTDCKMILCYQEQVREKQATAKEPGVKAELDLIEKYLARSLVRATDIRKKRKKKKTRRILLITIVIVLFGILIVTYKSYVRSQYANGLLQVESQVGREAVDAIKLVDAITNPIIPEEAKKGYYYRLSKELESNWMNTIVGEAYRYALNDVVPGIEGRYLWTANGNGNIAKWDTYTGEIVENETVSDNPLCTLAFSESEELIVAADSEGFLYSKQADGEWKKSEKSLEIPFVTEVRLFCQDGQNTGAVIDKTMIRYFQLEPQPKELWKKEYAQVHTANLTKTGVEAVVNKSGKLYYVHLDANGTVSEIEIPIENNSKCSIDIRDGRVLLADKNKQVVTWEAAQPEKITMTGLVLSEPQELCFLNQTAMVYYDQNLGTGLYELQKKQELGKILGAAPIVGRINVRGNRVAVQYGNDDIYSENVEVFLNDEKKEKISWQEMTEESAMSLVKEKLHMAVEPELFRIISRKTAKELELTVRPGADGEVWE